MADLERWAVDGPRLLDLGPARTLKVRLVSGRVDVVAHDDEGVRIEVGVVRGRPLQVTHDGDTVEVAHPQLRWEGVLGWLSTGSRNDTAEVSIAVPRGTAVEVGTVTADGLVSGVQGRAAVRTVSGTIVVDGVQGSLDARTVSGEITIRGHRGTVSGNSVSGGLVITADQLDSLRVKSVSGDLAVDLRGGPSAISVNTVSGELTIRMPSASGYDLNAVTASGAVVADGRKAAAGLPGQRRVHLTEGDASVRIDAKTVSGNVTLLRKPVAEDAGSGS